MIKFTKNQGVKFIDPTSSLIPLLLADGWAVEEDEEDQADQHPDAPLDAPKRGRKRKNAGDST